MKKPVVPNALREATKWNHDAVRDSGQFLLLWNPTMVDEVIPILQMGLAVYLDKPIIIVAPEGSVLCRTTSARWRRRANSTTRARRRRSRPRRNGLSGPA
jgi:hypothetical protein